MSVSTLEIKPFLEELVRILEKRMKEQDRTINLLRKEISSLRSEVERLSKGSQVDRSVIKVLRGE